MNHPDPTRPNTPRHAPTRPDTPPTAPARESRTPTPNPQPRNHTKTRTPNPLTNTRERLGLVKAHKIINRFSEDIDVNIIPPTEGTFGSGRRKRVRRELQARLNTGIPLPMEHRRYGDRFASTTITYPPLTGDSMVIAGGPTFGDVLVEMNIRDQPAETTNTATVTSLVGEAAAIRRSAAAGASAAGTVRGSHSRPDHRGCRQTRRAPLAQPLRQTRRYGIAGP